MSKKMWILPLDDDFKGMPVELRYVAVILSPLKKALSKLVFAAGLDMWGKRKLHFSCKLNMNAEGWRSILCVTVCQCLKKIIWNPLKEWQKIDGFFNMSFVLKENSSSKTDCFGVGHLSHDHVSQTNTPRDSGSSVVVPPNWQIANSDSWSVQGTSSKAHSCIGEMIGQT